MHFKIINNGFILGLGIGSSGTEITEEEYASLTDIFHAKPSDTEIIGYRLKDDTLEWESYDKTSEPVIIDNTEAIEILLGGAS